MFKPLAQDLLASSLATLGFAVFRRVEPGSFQLVAPPPSWLPAILGRPRLEVMEILELGSASLFLEDFLWDAEQHWAEDRAEALRSGPWHEVDRREQSYYLEAAAFTVDGRRVLTIQQLNGEFHSRVELFEQARRFSLQSRDLRYSLQKNDVLMEALAFDLTPQMQLLANGLKMLSAEGGSESWRNTIRHSLDILGFQDSSLQAILRHLSTDLASMRGAHRNSSDAPDIVEISRELVKSELNQFVDRGVDLRFECLIPSDSSTRVVGQKQRLELLLHNLLHLALRRAPLSSAMTFRLEAEPGERPTLRAEISVHPASPDPEYELFFGNPLTFSSPPFRWALMLHYCRVTAHRWGGELGFHSDEATAVWWLRLRLAT